MEAPGESLASGGFRAAWRFWAVGALFVTALLAAQVLSHVLLLAFTAAMVAVLLGALSWPLRHWLHLPHWAAIPLLCIVLVGLAVAVGFILGPRVVEQVNELRTQLPAAFQTAKSWVEGQSWLEGLLPSRGLGDLNLAGRLGSVFSTLAGTLTSLFVVVFASVFLAMQPHLYVNVVMHLMPQGKRGRTREVLHTLARGLRLWLLGRLAAMTLVGILTWGGLWLLDMRLALTLGLLAGVLTFVPFIGPVLAAMPALLLAVLQGPQQVLYVGLLYTVVQLIENNLLTPIAQRTAVSLPPAALLVAQLAAASLFGFLGVVLATPITVVLVLLVQMLYVRETLHDGVPLLTGKGASNAGD